MEKILLIEDEPDARTLLARRLAAHQFQVIEAADADSGIQKAKEMKPDLIVLDLKLPGKDGIEIYKTLREDPSTDAIPVLFLTAVAASGPMTQQSIDLIAAQKHGVRLEGKYAVMGKPYDPKDLIAAIRGLLT